LRAKERLYITDDDRLVNENDRSGRRLFYKPGDEIPDSIARKYGLLPVEKKAELKPEVKKKKPKGGLAIDRLRKQENKREERFV